MCVLSWRPHYDERGTSEGGQFSLINSQRISETQPGEEVLGCRCDHHQPTANEVQHNSQNDWGKLVMKVLVLLRLN